MLDYRRAQELIALAHEFDAPLRTYGPFDSTRTVDDQEGKRLISDDWVIAQRQIVTPAAGQSAIQQGMGITINAPIAERPDIRLQAEFPVFEALKDAAGEDSPAPVSLHYVVEDGNSHEVVCAYDAQSGQLQTATVEIGSYNQLSYAARQSGENPYVVAGRYAVDLQDEDWEVVHNRGSEQLAAVVPTPYKFEDQAVASLMIQLVPDLLYHVLDKQLTLDEHAVAWDQLRAVDFESYIGTQVLTAAFEDYGTTKALRDALLACGLHDTMHIEGLEQAITGQESDPERIAATRLRIIHEIFDRSGDARWIPEEVREDAQQAAIDHFLPAVHLALTELFNAIPSDESAVYLELHPGGQGFRFELRDVPVGRPEAISSPIRGTIAKNGAPVYLAHADTLADVRIAENRCIITAHRAAARDLKPQPQWTLQVPLSIAAEDSAEPRLMEALSAAADLHVDPMTLAGSLARLSIGYQVYAAA